MKYRAFGRHQFSVSEIGFGGWAIGGSWGSQSDADSLAALNQAIDLGVNFIDTAAVYGDGRSERLIGGVLRDRAARKRETIIVATKVAPTSGVQPPSPYCRADERYPEALLRESVDGRLANLGTRQIDLLQLHTWTRAWNGDPKPLRVLRELKREGKIGLIGVSAPDHDPNCVIDLMRGGWLDSVQIIYNLFEQEPAAELLAVAKTTGVGVIVRVVFDEGALTGKFTEKTAFPSDDFRARYFEGDRLPRVLTRIEAIRQDLAETRYTLAQAALKFALAHPAVSTVIPGIRNAAQATANCEVCELPDLSPELLVRLRRHNWHKGSWYGGK